MTEHGFDKFTRIAPRRRDGAVKAIQLLCNTNRAPYESTPSDREKIVQDIADALADLYKAYGVPRVLLGRLGPSPEPADQPDTCAITGDPLDREPEPHDDSPAARRATLDRSILQQKVDRGIAAVEQLGADLQALQDNVGK